MLKLTKKGMEIIMKNVLKKCPLFEGIEENELDFLLSCLSATEKSYKKDEFILSYGDKPLYVGIVLSGNIHIFQEDYWGNRSILASVEEGFLFGEAFSCSQIESIPVSVIANKETKVLLIDYKKIITTCTSTCTFHARLIQNMIKILANKNILLTQKISHLTKRSIREKLLSYLSEQALKSKSNSFEIPYNRQELSDFLAIDRSAMSNTLGKMRDEGIIKFNKNKFTLKQIDNKYY